MTKRTAGKIFQAQTIEQPGKPRGKDSKVIGYRGKFVIRGVSEALNKEKLPDLAELELREAINEIRRTYFS